MTELKKTVLHDTHQALGATMVDFGGCHMPCLLYTSDAADDLYTV